MAHLILVKTKELVNDDLFNDHLNYDPIEDWDSNRYGGDKEFNGQVEKVWNGYDLDLWRPKDIEKTKTWIKAHIEPQSRLLLAVEMMEQDRSVWFKTSW